MYLCDMKILPILLIIVSTNLFAQTNYNTIMNTQRDSLPQVDLHFKRYERMQTYATILHAASIVSLTALYYLTPAKPAMFLVPGAICATSITFHFASSYQYKKSKKYQEDLKNNFEYQ